MLSSWRGVLREGPLLGKRVPFFRSCAFKRSPPCPDKVVLLTKGFKLMVVVGFWFFRLLGKDLNFNKC
eukprot:2668626-Amphidinium_carterae.1